jgi:hypothetical protein
MAPGISFVPRDRDAYSTIRGCGYQRFCYTTNAAITTERPFPVRGRVTLAGLYADRILGPSAGAGSRVFRHVPRPR